MSSLETAIGSIITTYEKNPKRLPPDVVQAIEDDVDSREEIPKSHRQNFHDRLEQVRIQSI